LTPGSPSPRGSAARPGMTGGCVERIFGSAMVREPVRDCWCPLDLIFQHRRGENRICESDLAASDLNPGTELRVTGLCSGSPRSEVVRRPKAAKR
jgi:hypothetical protein